MAVALDTPVQATTNVTEVVGESGVRAYLVEEPTLPFVSVSLHFKGGGALDPEDKAGLAHMVSGLLDEGAGPYDSQAFRAELEDNAIRLSFEAERDGLTGQLKTLNETREHAFELLRLALTEPRFDEEPVERIREQILTDLNRRQSNPNYLSALGWFQSVFEGHPYATPTRGTPETIKRIETADLRRYVEDRLARGQLHIGVAGDITPEALAPLLDSTFGALPAEAKDGVIPEADPSFGEVVVKEMDIPQSVVTFGHGGIDRHHPDYYAAYVANYILGGGGFSSRLTEEIREKRGLAYSVYSYLMDTEAAPLWLGGVATRNDQVAQSIALVREELKRMAEGDIGEETLKDAKTYLTGSFPLRLTSNDAVARTLVAMQLRELGIDFLERRNAYVEAVTLEDVRRVAAGLFDQPLSISIVGQPEGVEG